MEPNTSKDRKDENQKRNEASENAGVFAGGEEGNQARETFAAKVTADDTRPRMNLDNDIDTGEAQNVTDGGQRIEGGEAENARNKAMEGIKQERDDSQRSGNNDRNSGGDRDIHDGNNDQSGRG